MALPGLSEELRALLTSGAVHDEPLSARENLSFYGSLYDLPDLAERVDSRLTEVGLGPAADRRVRGFSRGMRQRLALARTLLHDPSLVFLGQPFTGLDAPAAKHIQAVLTRRRSEGRGAVVVSHQFAEVWDIASHMMVMIEGAVIMRESPPPALGSFLPEDESLLHE